MRRFDWPPSGNEITGIGPEAPSLQSCPCLSLLFASVVFVRRVVQSSSPLRRVCIPTSFRCLRTEHATLAATSSRPRSFECAIFCLVPIPFSLVLRRNVLPVCFCYFSLLTFVLSCTFVGSPLCSRLGVPWMFTAAIVEAFGWTTHRCAVSVVERRLRRQRSVLPPTKQLFKLGEEERR